MRVRPSALLLGLGLALASFSPAPRDTAGRPAGPADAVVADPARLGIEEQALQTAARSDDATAALDYFRKRTPSEAQRRQLRNLIRNLSDGEFEVRQKASADLVASGPVAAGPLRAAARSPDAEVARRAQAALAQVRREGTAAIILSGVKLVVRRRPPETVAVLLAYLPFAEDEGVAEEIRASLAALTVQDGKPEPALVQALESADPEQRAEAGVILARANLADTRPTVRRLLTDEASVRLRVGRALLEAKDSDALPVLIEQFSDLVGDERWDLEDLLERIAGESAPAVPRRDDEATRRQRRAAWRSWWETQGDKADLSRAAMPQRSPGRLLLVEADLETFDGGVVEFGAEGRALREVSRVSGPIAAQGLAADRVLIAEYTGKRISERSFEDKVLWEKELPANPVAVQRLANGNTFVACRNRLLEIDRDGKTVSECRRPVRDVLGARRHPDGSIALVTDDGYCRWLDPSGQEVSRFPVGRPHILGVGIDVLPNKRVLVPCFGENRVAEYDARGVLLWEATVPGPVSAERLPDGHTLVGCTAPSAVAELDRMGRVVWQYQRQRALLQATQR
jgi:hypothetical protein